MLGFRIRYFGEIFSPGFGAGYALPAFLNAVLRVTLGGLMRLPALDVAARNSRVHDLADSAGLPLCRDVGVAQRLRMRSLNKFSRMASASTWSFCKIVIQFWIVR